MLTVTNLRLGLIALPALGLAALGPAAPAGAQSEQQAVIDKARRTVEVFNADPDLAPMRALLGAAKGVVVVPGLYNIGLIVGGATGPAVLLARDAERGWSCPAFYDFGMLTLGLQAGAEIARFVLLVMTERGLSALLRSPKVTLGSEVSVAFMPVGAGGEGTRAEADDGRDIYVFWRAKSLFGGFEIQDAALSRDEAWNAAYYGKAVTAKDIVIDRTVGSRGAEALKAALDDN